MATVVMRWLEQKPSDYDRGIEFLTLGRLQSLKQRIAREYIWTGESEAPSILELGCGTGELALLMAEAGAEVWAVDASEPMLVAARPKASGREIKGSVNFQLADATQITDLFQPGTFDFVVSTLVFSELRPQARRRVLDQARALLRENGRLLIADEVIPSGIFSRLVYWLVRLPLVLVTWLLTRTSTAPLRDMEQSLQQAGFKPTTIESHLLGSFILVGAAVVDEPASVPAPAGQDIPRLRHQTTAKTILLDLLSLVYRIFPPYPKRDTGLYRIGDPGADSPVLATGSYDLTVRRLVQELDGQVDCWLLVADSKGINVWCAAGGGHFTAESIISAINSSDVANFVSHRSLILPQLCANGVDGWRIRQATGWGVHWGPVRASDIPAYLFAKRKKSPAMRQVTFPMVNRLEMTTVMLALYGLLLLIPFLIFWPSKLATLLAITAALSYFYGIFLPWIPGRDGLEKGISLSLLALICLWTYAFGWGSFTLTSLFAWSVGLGFLAFFIGAEFQGLSPQMRGEQANWLIEGAVGATTLVLYAAGSLAIGALV